MKRTTHEPLITLHATPLELTLLGSAIIAYIRLSEQTLPPSEQKAVTQALQSFLQRYIDSQGNQQ